MAGDVAAANRFGLLVPQKLAAGALLALPANQHRAMTTKSSLVLQALSQNEEDRMSLLLRRRDADGSVHHYAIPFDSLALIAIVGIVVGFSLPLIFTFRNLVARQPDETALAIASGLAVGLTMFVIAKWSVIRTGMLVSFGPMRMTRSMRLLYAGGYVTMGCTAMLALLFVTST
ncbi:hypothetical protein FHS27_006568 [Rhodopirellula rubra]|uniref:Uncharacterized protein n=1 Tax=Aporhodopirellula rubra TaxID=980271 RepID=A0A7W5E5V5_9BACT|nr:hypothetical protein [Aporhodopirellula rubra]MBB3210720.1 hypothetical protein [Aporhodopirellula rubra]